MKNKITVIIPVYNDEKNICKILDILSKKNNIKTIVINDGSTDKTEEMILKNKFKNLEYISLKNNLGISNARNIGLENVKTKYYTFIDSDDIINVNALEILYNEAEKNELDMCCCNYYEKINNRTIKSKYVYDNKIYNKNEIIEMTFKDKISTVSWAKLYKTETYKNIKFNKKLKINEDYEYIINCFLNSKRIKIINKYLYIYQKNNNSITNKLKCIDIKNNNYINYLDKKLKKQKNYEFYVNINELRNIHLYSKCTDKKNRYKFLKKEINRKKLKKLLREKINLLNKIEIIIFLINIRVYLIIYPACIIAKNIIRRKK